MQSQYMLPNYNLKYPVGDKNMRDVLYLNASIINPYNLYGLQIN